MNKGVKILMKLEIIIDILFDLLSKKSVTALYLSQKYGVSTRSIYRYIACLENAGVPIYTTRGKYGGFSIIDTYRLSATFMTVAEFEQTINALTSITESVPDKLLSNALSKLKAAVKNEYAELDIKSGSLIIDAGRWGDTAGYKSKLAVVTKSIDESRKLYIKYHDRNGEITERLTEPHYIVLKQGLWYVYAYCHLRKGFRFFKVGRIENAYVTNEKFVRQNIRAQDLPLEFWENGNVAERVVLKVEKRVLSDVEEWLGIENIEKIGDEYFAKATLPTDNGLVSKIMAFGDGVKVLAPANLQKMITEAAKKILSCY